MPASAVREWAIDTPAGAIRFLSERGIEPDWDEKRQTAGFSKHLNPSASRVIKKALQLDSQARVAKVCTELKKREDWDSLRKRFGANYE